jgi:hypothetical protein
MDKRRQLNSSEIEEILLRNPLNLKLERETGLEPATTCLEVNQLISMASQIY